MPKRRHAHRWPPKGSYPHPDGGYVLPGKAKNGIQVTGHLKAEPDTEKLAKRSSNSPNTSTRRNARASRRALIVRQCSRD